MGQRGHFDEKQIQVTLACANRKMFGLHRVKAIRQFKIE
jgi:hypothetical protein